MSRNFDSVSVKKQWDAEVGVVETEKSIYSKHTLEKEQDILD